jgi:hypothetical protein
VGGNTIETSEIPYSVQQAVKNHPVTLWSYDCGDPCAKARAHLVKRGVPFTERSPQKELDAMKKATGGTDVPFLVVGSTQLKGYLDTAWDAALDTAGYPRTPPPGFKAQVKSAAEAPGVKAGSTTATAPAGATAGSGTATAPAGATARSGTATAPAGATARSGSPPASK